MRRLSLLLIALVCLTEPSLARADQGALTADLGGGVVGMSLPTPYANEGQATGGAFTVWGGARYAVFNWLEASASLFYEPPVAAWHHGVEVDTGDGRFAGSLTHRTTRYGGLVGARYVRGALWRFTAGIEVGVSRRVYSHFALINQSQESQTGQGEAFDYGLNLPEMSVFNLVLAPVAGLEWAGGDHWSLSLLPRVSFLLGPSPTLAVTLPLVFSWSWYL